MFLNSAECLECNWQVFCGGGMELSRRFDTGHISKLWPQLPWLWLRGFIKVFTESQALWGPAGTTQPKVQQQQHRNTNFITFVHLEWIYMHTQDKGKLYYLLRCHKEFVLIRLICFHWSWNNKSNYNFPELALCGLNFAVKTLDVLLFHIDVYFNAHDAKIYISCYFIYFVFKIFVLLCLFQIIADSNRWKQFQHKIKKCLQRRGVPETWTRTTNMAFPATNYKHCQFFCVLLSFSYHSGCNIRDKW